jgi:hypothetical protein
VKPGASLSKLEEVLVVTQMEDRLPTPGEQTRPVRAVDILTQRLPSVPDKPATDPNTPSATTGAAGTSKPPASSAPQAAGTAVGASKPLTPSAQAPKVASPTTGAGATQKTVPAKPDAAQTVAPQTSPNPDNSAPRGMAPAGAVNGVAAKVPAATGTAGGQGTVKPTVLPKPPANTADKSAQPASAKPQAPPVEDKPE